MRLHRLRVTAFQAFAGSEEVDFDALSSAGLFLLRGDTGAGKTTLLDAVCFALYGEVPGARARDARLRSDHAADDVRTEVELEVTLRDRRFRIVRRPKQERPKVRGDGVTEEGHACTVQELRDGDWRTLAARPDEARAELADPLGMTCDQFCQVVLLPQGEFASFLRAGSDERWKLLERLFGTERFAQVEWWLRDRARAARADLHSQLGAVRDVVARLAQASGEEPPADWEVDPASVREWTGGLSVGAQANAVTAQEAAVGARAARAEAERAFAVATELAERRERFARAEAELMSWQAKRGVRDEAERILRAARAAAPVAPLLAAAAARGEEAAAAAEAAEAAWEQLDEESREVAEAARVDAEATPDAADPPPAADAPPSLFDDALTLFDVPSTGEFRTEEVQNSPLLDAEPDPRAAEAPGDVEAAPALALRERAGELRSQAGAFGELVAVEQRLDADEQALARLLAEAESASARGAAATQALAAAEQTRARLDGAAQTARRAADRLDALAAEATAAEERAAQAAERDRLAAAQAQLADRVRAAVDAEQTARAAWLDLRERRLAGMAAELSATLAPGEPCAVSPGQVIPYTNDELNTFPKQESCFFGNLFTGQGIYAGSRGTLLNQGSSSSRACAVVDSSGSQRVQCAPLFFVGECGSVCTLDASGLFYARCNYAGVEYRPLVTRLRDRDVYRCGDGICQVTESCGTGSWYNSCHRDCGVCK